MTEQTGSWGRIVRWLAAGAALVALGATGMYVYLRSPSGPTGASPAPPAAATDRPALQADEVSMTLTPDAIERAGIVIAPSRAGRRATSLRIPGVVEPDAYRQVVVTAVAAGRILSVEGELGQVVRRGDELARMHVPELAEAERAYVSMRAELEATRLDVARVERLVTIGAASQQELDSVRATHTKYATEVENARARMVLLGLGAAEIDRLTSATAINPDVAIRAPIDGTITRRLVNRGQNVEGSAELFTVVDLSNVWIVGDVYERDLSLVRVGSPVVMTAAALPGASRRGSISYIDPQVAPESRTARVRVELLNRDGGLRLGMYVDLVIEDPSAAEVALIPRAAVQTIDAVAVVYVVDDRQAGRFIERSVLVGADQGADVEILSGLRPGERVVVAGSFALRSERERRGFAAPPAPPAPVRAAPPTVRREIRITPEGFSPATLDIPAGTPVDLVFLRTTDQTCATEVVVPALNLRHDLPLNREVVVHLPAQPAGTIGFACGMDMVRGSIVVK
jgi:cobalt-zinc-cadmium efflux system membrane fusion protein